MNKKTIMKISFVAGIACFVIAIFLLIPKNEKQEPVEQVKVEDKVETK